MDLQIYSVYKKKLYIYICIFYAKYILLKSTHYLVVVRQLIVNPWGRRGGRRRGEVNKM